MCRPARLDRSAARVAVQRAFSGPQALHAWLLGRELQGHGGSLRNFELSVQRGEARHHLYCEVSSTSRLRPRQGVEQGHFHVSLLVVSGAENQAGS